MLGRLRMSVDHCIDEYERLARDLFANPRRLHLRTCGPFVPREKFNYRVLEGIVDQVVGKRSVPPQDNDIPRQPKYPSPDDLCRT